MKHSFSVNHVGTVSVSSEYLGNKESSWGDNWNNHKITIRHDGRSCSFDFWASIANPEVRTVSDLGNAVFCFLSDAESGKMDFSEFCNEFGYDEDSRRSEKTWNACKKSLSAAERVFGSDLDSVMTFFSNNYC